MYNIILVYYRFVALPGIHCIHVNDNGVCIKCRKCFAVCTLATYTTFHCLEPVGGDFWVKVLMHL